MPRRAKQACVSCHAKRVKCNVTEEMPCQNCLAIGSSCILRDSRRGKHLRASARPRMAPATTATAGSRTIPPPASLPEDREAVVVQLDSPSPLLTTSNNGIAQNQRRRGPASPASTAADTTVSSALPQFGPGTDEATVFLGESTSIRYVFDNAASPQNSGLHHQVPLAARAERLTTEWEMAQKAARMETLQAGGVFALPEKTILHALLKSYFKYFHTCFAVVDESDTWAQYEDGTLSPFLLNAVLFIAAVHCDQDIIVQLGFGCRQQAKHMFFSHAKDMYDADCESRTLPTIQALFLLSFWRGGIEAEKDTRHWLGSAITLAQKKGLHRSSTSLNSHPDKLRRRVWWSIYVRERQSATALGLPSRIHDEDCDVAPLQESDFEFAFSSSTPQARITEYVNYEVRMADLSRILGKIGQCMYRPLKSSRPFKRSEIRGELSAWMKTLPGNSMTDDDPLCPPSFHASMLHLAFNYLIILLYRSDYIVGGETGRETEGAIALQAAARNSRIVEDMLSDGNLRHAPIHVITIIFITLCIHTVSLRRSEGVVKTVAQSRANTCLLGLQELRGTWEVRNFAVQLFFQYLDHSTAANLRWRNETECVSCKVAPARASTVSNMHMHPGDDGYTTSNTTANVTRRATDVTEDINSWSAEKQNDFLFSQIESSFAFGEGDMLPWELDDCN